MRYEIDGGTCSRISSSEPHRDLARLLLGPRLSSCWARRSGPAAAGAGGSRSGPRSPRSRRRRASPREPRARGGRRRCARAAPRRASGCLRGRRRCRRRPRSASIARDSARTSPAPRSIGIWPMPLRTGARPRTSHSGRFRQRLDLAPPDRRHADRHRVPVAVVVADDAAAGRSAGRSSSALDLEASPRRDDRPADGHRDSVHAARLLQGAGVLLTSMALVLAFATTARLHNRLEVIGGSVLPVKDGICPVLAGAEVSAVDHKALFAALHGEDELAHRCVGDRFQRSF